MYIYIYIYISASRSSPLYKSLCIRALHTRASRSSPLYNGRCMRRGGHMREGYSLQPTRRKFYAYPGRTYRRGQRYAQGRAYAQRYAVLLHLLLPSLLPMPMIAIRQSRRATHTLRQSMPETQPTPSANTPTGLRSAHTYIYICLCVYIYIYINNLLVYCWHCGARNTTNPYALFKSRSQCYR